MSNRQNRRRCGLALGLLMTWQSVEVRGETEPQPLPLQAAGEPAVIELESTPLEAQAAVAGPTERVVERYPNRLVKIERQVAQDKVGNFFNHGPWAKWSEDGRLMGQGEFRNGAQHGPWVRLYSVEETQAVFASALALGFEAPFSSMVGFEDGRLHGTWVVLDAKKRQVSATEFQDGERHGKSLTWYPTGKKFRDVEYRAGELDGAATEYDATEKLVKQEKFVNGYRHGIKVEHYATGEVKSECETLFAKEVIESVDNWWDGTTEVAVIGTIGQDQRHGKFTAFSLDGVKVLEGTYADDRPEGKFTWWHDNGNKAIEGFYVDGKQDGIWTWWYSNGLKELTGEYVMGEEGGNWRAWEDNGLVVTSMSVFETPLYEASEAVDLQPAGADTPEAEVKIPASDASEPLVEAVTPSAEAAASPAVKEPTAAAETPRVGPGSASAMQALFPAVVDEPQLEAVRAVELQPIEVQQPAEVQQSHDDLPRPKTPSIRPASFRRLQQ